MDPQDYDFLGYFYVLFAVTQELGAANQKCFPNSYSTSRNTQYI